MYNTHSVGMWLKDWRKRYFVLKGNKLYFCKTSHVSSVFCSNGVVGPSRRDRLVKVSNY